MNVQNSLVDEYPEPNIWEAPLQRVMEEYLRPGDTAFDVGANIGALSAFMWQQVGPLGRVDSFEANPTMIDRLKRNFELNGVRHPNIVARAAWSRSGVPLTFEVEPGYYSSGSRIISAGPSEGACADHVTVTSLALDDYCDETALAPDLIKIDVEGAERHVLEGSIRLLKRKKPTVLIEHTPTPNPNDAPGFLRKLGYRLVDCHDYSLWDGTRTSGPLTNLIAVHPENDRSVRQSLNVPQLVDVERFNLTPQKDKAGRTYLQSEMVAVPAGWWLFAAAFDYAGSGMGSIMLVDEQQRAHYRADTRVPYLSEYVCSHAIVRTAMPARFRLSVSPLCDELELIRGTVILKQVVLES
jgi:FkbM family methyltransferase